MNLIFKKISAFILPIFILGLLMTPLFVSAWIVPDCAGVNGVSRECGFNDLVILAKNIINFLVQLSIPLSAAAFIYAGYLFLTSAGDESKIKQGKEIFTKVLKGLFFVLVGWLIVYTLTSALLRDGSFLELIR